MNIKCEITSNESNRFFKEFPVELLLSVRETTKLKDLTVKICQNELDMDDLNLKLNLNFRNAAANRRRLHLEMELITCDGENKV